MLQRGSFRCVPSSSGVFQASLPLACSAACIACIVSDLNMVFASALCLRSFPCIASLTTNPRDPLHILSVLLSQTSDAGRRKGVCSGGTKVLSARPEMGEVHRRAAALAAGALLLACSLSQVLADAGLPGDWHTGIATNYGGAQDGMVCDRSHIRSALQLQMPLEIEV